MKRLFTMILGCTLTLSLLAQTTTNNEEHSNSIFIGTNAGAKDNGNNDNTFIGTNSGMTNTSGNENTFLGMDAGMYNQTGYSNTFVGTDAGKHNNVGSYNTFLGQQSGLSNTTGFGNTFIGQAAGKDNQDGSLNTFIGRVAGKHNTEGNANTFIGQSAGYNNTSGFFNTFIGQFTGLKNTTGYSNTFIGLSSGRKNQTGINNTFLGQSAGMNNTTGSYNTFIGLDAGKSNSTGKKNTFIGHGASKNEESAPLSNAIAIGYEAKVDCDNCAVIGGVDDHAVNVGIGTSSPSFQLHLSTNSAAKPGSSTWLVAADERLKQEITPFSEGLSVIEQIEPIWYEYNGIGGLVEGQKHIGVLAQDIETIAPYMVNEFKLTNNDTTGQYLSFDANALLYLLINAVKEQQVLIENQISSNQSAIDITSTTLVASEEIDNLKTQVADLTTLVESLLAEKKATSLQISQHNLSLSETSLLKQNRPNPFEQHTIIPYFIPSTTQRAAIQVTALDGTIIYEVNIQEKGAGQLALQARDFPTGNYYYTLLLDGEVVSSKKMVMSRQ